MSLFPKRQPSLSGPWGLAPPATFLGTMFPGRGCIWETVGLDKLSIGLCPQNWAGDQEHLLAGALNLDTIPPSPACPQQSGSGHLLQAWAARESQTDPQAGGPSGRGGGLGPAPSRSPSRQGAAQPNLEAMWPQLAGHTSPPDFTRLSHPVISSAWGGVGVGGGQPGSGNQHRLHGGRPLPPGTAGWLALPWNAFRSRCPPCKLPAARESLECRAEQLGTRSPVPRQGAGRRGEGREGG